MLQSLDGLGGRQDQQFNCATLSLLLDFFHYWQPAVRAGSDHKSLTFPGYFFLNRQWRVAELLAEFFGWLLLAFANFAAINDDIVLVRIALDLDRPEGEFVETHRGTLQFKRFS